MFLSEQAPKSFTALVYRAAKNNTVWTRKIYVFEYAVLLLLGRRKANGLDARFGDAHHLPRFHFANVLRVEKIKRASFGRYHPRFRGTFRRGQSAKHQQIV